MQDFYEALDRTVTRPSRLYEQEKLKMHHTKIGINHKQTNLRTDLLADGDLCLVIDRESEFYNLCCRVKLFRNNDNVDLLVNGHRVGTVSQNQVKRIREELP